MLRFTRRFCVPAASQVGALSRPGQAKETDTSLADLALRVEQLELAAGDQRSAHRRAGDDATHEAPMPRRVTPFPKPGGIMADAPEVGTDETAASVLDHESFENMYQFLAQQPIQRVPFQKVGGVKTREDLTWYGNLLRRTLPVDLAKQAKMLAHVPFGLSQTTSMKLLRRHHEESFLDCTRFFAEHPEMGEETATGLCRLLIGIFVRHISTTELVATACKDFVARNHLYERVRDEGAFYRQYQPMQESLDTLMAERIKVRFKIGQFISCAHRILGADILPPGHGGDAELGELKTFGLSQDCFTGQVCESTSIYEVAKQAIEHARLVMATAEPGGPTIMQTEVPVVNLRFHGDPKFTFLYVPLQSYNIISSLVAHAMKVTMRKRRRLGSTALDPVQVLIAQMPGSNDVTVRVTDTAGGIPLEMVQWSQTYLYSARETQILARCPEATAGTYAGRFAGPIATGRSSTQSHEADDLLRWMQSGVRFPYARVSAHVFGGDIKLVSVPGERTEAYYYCPTHGLPSLEI